MRPGASIFGEAATARERTRALIVFNADGSTRFRLQPSASARFGETVYTGPWLLHQIYVSTNPDGSRSVWASFIHGLWFPRLLLEADGVTGRVTSTDWSNGYIDTVVVSRWRGRPVVFVGAANNETNGGSLAVFEHQKVYGAAPAGRDAYRCQDCAMGGPVDENLPKREAWGRMSAGAAAGNRPGRSIAP